MSEVPLNTSEINAREANELTKSSRVAILGQAFGQIRKAAESGAFECNLRVPNLQCAQEFYEKLRVLIFACKLTQLREGDALLEVSWANVAKQQQQSQKTNSASEEL